MTRPIATFLLSLLCLLGSHAVAQKNIHVFVALCDNKYQGIVPVSASLGNGQSPSSNLYWGAAYGCKTFFRRSADWEWLGAIPSGNPIILERIVFRHKTSKALMLVDAYDGQYIKDCTTDFLKASNGQRPEAVTLPDGADASFGGAANLVAYVGHDGLMEFSVDVNYQASPTPPIDVIILACASQPYFSQDISQAGANPVLWTTNLMAPEAYVLDAALKKWLALPTDGAAIREAAAAAYNAYQKCGINGARRLFATGFK